MRRRNDTTEMLKESMGTALLELMMTKPLERISIEEMTAKADIGRVTYYRHFKSKEDVLVFKIVTLWKRFADTHYTFHSDTNEDKHKGISLFFEFCLTVRYINDILYETGHQNVILDAYLSIMLPSQKGDDYYLVSFTAYGLFGLVNAWILSDYKETPAEMATIALKLGK